MRITDVTAAIMCKEGRILIAKRGKGDKLANKWEFPGGKIELGESPEDCLKREMAEEFGILIEVKDFFTDSVYSYAEGKIRLLAFFTTWVAGELIPTVHDEIKWVAIEKLQDYELAPADIPIAKKLIVQPILWARNKHT